MSTFLLDTSTISQAMQREPNPKVVRLMMEHGVESSIAALTWHELRYGVARLPKSKRRAVLEQFLVDVIATSMDILPYDERAAAWHADERARLEQSGKTAPFVDGQIAAIAFTKGLPIVTANPKDFRFFKGLRVLDWSS